MHKAEIEQCKEKLHIAIGLLLVATSIALGAYEVVNAHKHLSHVILAGIMLVFGLTLVAENQVIRLLEKISQILSGLLPAWLKGITG